MKSVLYTILLGALAFMTIGASCEERLIQLPVVGYVEHVFPVNSPNGSFLTTDTIDFSSQIAQLQEENTFEGIIAISLESVSYTIMDNASAAGSVVNGLAQVSATSFASMDTLAILSAMNLDDVEDLEQIPDLNTDGVSQINQAIHIDTGTNQLYFSVMGNVTPVPPPNLNFNIKVKVSFTIVGEVKTEVPVI